MTQKSERFTYDVLNRLKTVQDGTYAAEPNPLPIVNWQQTFAYDRNGNRALVGTPNAFISGDSSGSTTHVPQVSADTAQAIAGAYPAKNQWSGATYDAAGNVTALPNRSMSYDGENRLVSGTMPTVGNVAYEYDGEGKRVRKTAGSAVTVFVYDAMGRLAAEYGTSAPPEIGTRFYASDPRLGSTRLMSDAVGNVRKRSDYAPFGEEIPPVYRDSSYTA